MNTQEYFKDKSEPMPLWLKNYKKGSKINFDEVLNSRVVYYPGSAFDGQPIRLYNTSHAAHTFLYVDYLIDKEQVRNELCAENALNGYHLIDIQELNENDLVNYNVKYHVTLSNEQVKSIKSFAREEPFCFLAVYERNEGFDDSHGASRLALIYLYADGIATYDALFINRNKAPFLVVLQDHGFGGNYDGFGEGYILPKIARDNNVLPTYVLCAENTRLWNEYRRVPNVNSEVGGMCHHTRFLCRKVSKN